VVCIIATIVLPELLLPPSQVKTEDDRREKCARYHDTLRFAVISFSSVVTELSIPSQKLLAKSTAEPVNHTHFCQRMAFWRGTGRDSDYFRYSVV
jgi:hypothetical protein